jgi:hypothetical protein
MLDDRVEQNQHAASFQGKAVDVAAADEIFACTDLITAHRRGDFGAGFETPRILLECFNVRFEFLDTLTLGERRRIVNGTLLTILLQLLDQDRGARPGADRFAFGTLDGVAQQH